MYTAQFISDKIKTASFSLHFSRTIFKFEIVTDKYGQDTLSSAESW